MNSNHEDLIFNVLTYSTNDNKLSLVFAKWLTYTDKLIVATANAANDGFKRYTLFVQYEIKNTEIKSHYPFAFNTIIELFETMDQLIQCEFDLETLRQLYLDNEMQ